MKKTLKLSKLAELGYIQASCAQPIHEFEHVKGEFYSTVWRLNHLQIMRMTIYIVLYLFSFSHPEEGAIIILARQHHKKFNFSYEATIHLVYNLKRQNLISNWKQQWTRYMFHKWCCKPWTHLCPKLFFLIKNHLPKRISNSSHLSPCQLYYEFLSKITNQKIK
jgi:hypothetical protein